MVEEITALGVELLAVPGLHLGDYVLGKVRPPAAPGSLVLEVALPHFVVFVRVRHRQIAREDVVESGYVRRALDGRVPAQRHDAAARTPDVAQEELQDRGRTDDLHALGMLRPADRVAQRRGLLPSRVLGQGPGYLEESLLRGAADLLDHLGRVPGEVALEDLEHAARVLQRHVGRPRHTGMHLPALSLTGLAHYASLAPPDGGVIDRVSLVTPARRVVQFAIFVPTGEQARGVGFLEILGYDRGRVGVDLDVFLEVLLVLEDVVDQAPEERDIGAGPDGCVDVTHRRGAREARVDVDELGALLFGDHGVPEANRVGLCHVGALDEDAVSVLQILQVGGGPAPTVRDAQTGHRGAVSYPRLVRDPHEPQRVEELGYEVVLLIVDRGASDGGQGHGAVQLLALRVFRFPGLLPGHLDPLGDHIERLLEREFFPLARERPAVADLGPAVRRDVQPEGGRALRTERASVYGAVRVPLDVHNAPVAVVDERRAAYGTVRTHAHGLLYTLIGDARADVAGRRAYRVLDRRADVVPDLLPETVFLREP